MESLYGTVAGLDVHKKTPQLPLREIERLFSSVLQQR